VKNERRAMSGAKYRGGGARPARADKKISAGRRVRRPAGGFVLFRVRVNYSKSRAGSQATSRQATSRQLPLALCLKRHRDKRRVGVY
jgi:hypothetical protein